MMQQEMIRGLLLGMAVLFLSNRLRGKSESGRVLLAFDCNFVVLLSFKTSKP
jgi:hypothetical protein